MVKKLKHARPVMGLVLALCVISTLVSCHGSQKAAEGGSLVLYYSQNGTTARVAHILADRLGADTLAFDVTPSYGHDYQTTINRCLSEMPDSVWAELLPLHVDVASYDTIWLGYPVWFGTYARPVGSLLRSVKFAGKVVIPFCTFGSGGLESSVADLRRALPDAEVHDGYGIRAARIDAAGTEVVRFLIDNGYIEGERQILPEYTEQQDMTDSDSVIFQQACGSYPMPLGTPVSVGRRVLEDRVELLYRSVMQSRDNQDPDTALVYVSVPMASDAAPEFTRVVR